jgi:hypothetical protein
VTIGTGRSESTHDGLDRRVRIVEKGAGASIPDANPFRDGTEIISTHDDEAVGPILGYPLSRWDGCRLRP